MFLSCFSCWYLSLCILFSCFVISSWYSSVLLMNLPSAVHTFISSLFITLSSILIFINCALNYVIHVYFYSYFIIMQLCTLSLISFVLVWYIVSSSCHLSSYHTAILRVRFYYDSDWSSAFVLSFDFYSVCLSFILESVRAHPCAITSYDLLFGWSLFLMLILILFRNTFFFFSCLIFVLSIVLSNCLIITTIITVNNDCHHCLSYCNRYHYCVSFLTVPSCTLDRPFVRSLVLYGVALLSISLLLTSYLIAIIQSVCINMLTIVNNITSHWFIIIGFRGEIHRRWGV